MSDLCYLNDHGGYWPLEVGQPTPYRGGGGEPTRTHRDGGRAGSLGGAGFECDLHRKLNEHGHIYLERTPLGTTWEQRNVFNLRPRQQECLSTLTVAGPSANLWTRRGGPGHILALTSKRYIKCFFSLLTC
jgi:hypothetical protein